MEQEQPYRMMFALVRVSLVLSLRIITLPGNDVCIYSGVGLNQRLILMGPKEPAKHTGILADSMLAERPG